MGTDSPVLTIKTHGPGWGQQQANDANFITLGDKQFTPGTTSAIVVIKQEKVGNK